MFGFALSRRQLKKTNITSVDFFCQNETTAKKLPWFLPYYKKYNQRGYSENVVVDIYRKIDETCVDVCDLLLRFVKKTVLLSADWIEDEESHRQQRIADVVGKSDSGACHRPPLDWELLDLWKDIKRLPHLTLDGTLGHAEEIKRIQNRVDFLQKAYLRCKSFFETQYGSDLGHEGKAVSYEYERTKERPGYNRNTEELEEQTGNTRKASVEATQQHLQRVAGELEQIYTHLKAGIQTGSFQWIDSILIKALVAGNWLLIDGANRCSAAVLDRLNSLMEPHGSLVLSERGSLDGKIVEIKPHPYFRLILTMDPAYGEISRAMRNRGVEIFMSTSPSTLWDHRAASGPGTALDVDISGDSCATGENENAVSETRVMPWTNEDVCPTLQSEFGINIFDLDALLRTEGLCNPRLRTAVLNLHREIHQAVASPSGTVGIENRFSKVVLTARHMLLQMENGVSYKDALWTAFHATFVEDHFLIDSEKKLQIHEIITRYCQGLDDNFIGKLKEKPLPIMCVGSSGNSQTYRIWKSLEVIANALSESSWSQYESWRTKENRKLVEDFLIAAVFSRVMKKDVGGLQLAVSKLYPQKAGFASKLTSVLESTIGESFESFHNQRDIQGVAHLMAKFTDRSRQEQGKLLDRDLKMSLRLHSENEIFHSKSLESHRKGTLGFVAKNIKKTDSGNLSEFLYGFWQIVTKYDNLVDSCLSCSFPNAKNLYGIDSSESIVAQYARIWKNGMVAVLWRKWITELAQEEFDYKRPSEKLYSNIALMVQWIGEQVVPVLHAIRGMASSSQGKELEALVQKCLEPLDHCGNRMRLQRSASFRSFYGIRPFLPSDSLNIVNAALSLCLKLWVANAPVDPEQIEKLLTSCAEGQDGVASHRFLREVCRKLLKITSLPVSLEEAQCLAKIRERLEETLQSRDVSIEEISNDWIKQCHKVVAGIEDFLRLLNIPSSQLKYSVFVSPLLEAVSTTGGTQYEFLKSILLWEDKERFRQHYTDCPPAIMMESSCLLPYFMSRVFLDDKTLLIRSASLGCREQLLSHYKTLSRHLSNELIRPRMRWESTSGLAKSKCESFLELVRKWKQMFSVEDSTAVEMQAWESRLEDMVATDGTLGLHSLAELGCVMAEASCFVMEAATYLPVVDPSVENEVLAKYLKDEMEYFSSWSAAQRLYGLYTCGRDILHESGSESGFAHVHPHVAEVFRSLQTAESKLKHAESNIAARPDPPEYVAMRNEALQFVRTMGSKHKIAELTSRVRTLFANASVITEHEVNGVLVPCSSWVETCSNFVHKQLKRFWYWDICLSYIHPMLQAITGFTLICDAVRKSKVDSNSHGKAKVLEMLRFPSNSMPKVADASRIYEDPWAYKRATKKLLLSSLWVFYNKVVSYNCITPNLIAETHEFAREVARLWKEQQEEKEQQKEMENALYIYKGREKKLESSEEEKEMENIADLFPDFANDFQDLIEVNSLETSTVTDISSTTSTDVDILEAEDVDLFLKVHNLALSYVRNHCLKITKPDCKYNFETPFVNLFEIGSCAFQNNYMDYRKEEEGVLLISSNLMMKRMYSSVIETDDNELYDVYRDPNISEVVRLGPILCYMRKRIQELLAEFPEHPALLRIIELMARIDSFDVKSPLMKFLTGLEMLLATSQEWETVAHRGVSIATHLLEVSNLVISWRKLELRYWKNLLQIHLLREQRQAKQWWFHLFNSSLEFSIDNADHVDKQKNFLNVLQKFMESSPLGQFTTRLSLLEELHRHFVGLLRTSLYDDMAKTALNDLISYIWNSIMFYRQFVPAANSRLKSLSAPIEKNIKDFIKISRWTDANFYALRDSVKKSQKTLSKLVTDYKRVLHEPVSTTVLVSDIGMGSQLLEKKKSKFNKTKKLTYVMPEEWSERIVFPVSPDALALQSLKRLPKLQKYYSKSRAISEEVIGKDDKYSSHILEVDELTGAVIERVHELQNLQVPEEKGDKRKKALHHVHNLRRKNLSELFKTLQDIGLSFRRGIIYLKNQDNETDFCDFTTEPVDLTTGWKNMQHGNDRFPADNELIDAWNGCEMYFQKCISRISVMLKSFHSPSKELGPNIIDRCKGYLIDLLQVVTEEKRVIAKCSKLLWELRMLARIDKTEEVIRIKENLIWSLYKAAAEMENEYREYVIVAESLNDEHSDITSSFKTGCETITAKLASVKTNLYEVVNDTHFGEEWNCAISTNVVTSCLTTFDNVFKTIENCQGMLVQSSVLWDSLTRSRSRWTKWLADFQVELQSDSAPVSTVSSEAFTTLLEKTIESILLAYQHLDAAVKNDKDSQNEKLTGMLPIKRLLSLELNGIVPRVLHLRQMLSQTTNEEYYQRVAMYRNLVPLLLQFSFTSQFYLKLSAQEHRASSKLLSVLSAVFATLAQKGFCLPSDYENDAIEEGPEIDEKSGMGLGEGETTSDAQDVSDRLESEDQLDDTMKAGETAESADKDVGEDDKGVEMSEDFDGKQQDKKKPGEDEKDDCSEDEHENEDMDKEMGDVDADGEKLDDKLWGGSSDEEEEDTPEQKKEKGKGAPEKGETELAPNKEDQNEEDDGTQEDQSKENVQNKEFNDKEDDEEINDDQVDPYHGQSQPEEEPEPMDLPEDLQLDDAEAKGDTEQPEENPFDLDSADRELPEGFDEKQEEEMETPEGEGPTQLSDDEEANDEESAINIEGPELDEDPNNTGIDTEETDQPMDVDEENEEQDNNAKEKVDTNTTESTNNEDEEKTEPSAVPSTKNDDSSAANPDNSKDNVPARTQEEENPSKANEQASGQVESNDGQGHEGTSVNENRNDSSRSKPDADASRKPGETDSKRSLMDSAENVQDQLKRLKTVDKLRDNSSEGINEEKEGDESEQTAAELYQHIQSADKKDALTIDNATKEQMEKQKGMQTDNEVESENPPLDDTVSDMEIDEDVEELPEADVNKNAPDLIRGLPENKKKPKNKSKDIDDSGKEIAEVEGERVSTYNVQRPADSYSHTNLGLLKEKNSEMKVDLELIEVNTEEIMDLGSEGQALVEWHDLESKTMSLSQELCEQLRLILEPTQAARLKGDYKTGKRLNMRKVIPYIASGFRKDKIWLRRTQPSKREYQILLALDDSASMLDNQSKQMAFSAVAVVSRALTLLEAGKLAVGSFGEDFKLIHPFDEPFTDGSGARIIQQFTFAQKRTRIAQLMQYSTALFTQSKSSSSGSLHPDVAQLMIIVSDGRGINNEGVEVTKKAIMKAREQNVFIVFIIVDNPENQNSILDIRQPIFGPNNSVEIVRYMDNFPFPFYLILRDISSLPTVLSDALRQWFELVTSSDR